MWLCVLVGIYPTGFTPSKWVAAEPNGVYSATINDDGIATIQPAQVDGKTCAGTYGGLAGCVLMMVACASGSTCTTRPTHIVRSDSGGVIMEYAPVTTTGYDSNNFFLVQPNEVMVGLTLVGDTEIVHEGIIPPTHSLRKTSVMIDLGAFNTASSGVACDRQAPPLAVTAVLDLDKNVVTIGGQVNPHAGTCQDRPVATKACTTITLNYTTEVAALMPETIGLWLYPHQFSTPAPTTADHPQVWKVFRPWTMRMASFALEYDYYVGLLQFPGTALTINDWLLSPLLLAELGDQVTVTTDATGLAYLTRSSIASGSAATNVTMVSGVSAAYKYAQSYFAVFKGGDCVALKSTGVGPATFQLNLTQIHIRGNSAYDYYDTVQDYDISFSQGFDLPSNGGTRGLRTISTARGLQFELFDAACTASSCGLHGSCQAASGVCQCDAGWAGAACDIPTGAASSSSTGLAPNGTVPEPPLLPGVPWSSGVGLSIAAAHVTMGLLLPNWSFKAALSVFQTSALLAHSGVQLPTSMRSMAAQLDLLNFNFVNPGADLPSQQPTPEAEPQPLQQNRRLLASAGPNSNNRQISPAEYSKMVREHSDVFTVTLISVVCVWAAALALCAILLLVDRCLHGPLDQKTAMRMLVGKHAEQEDEAEQDDENEADVESSIKEGEPSPPGESYQTDETEGQQTEGETSPETTKTDVPTLVWFARNKSVAYRLHLRALPVCVTLHIIKLAYYGLCFSGYRHVSWFGVEHSTPGLTFLAWLVVLTMALGVPYLVWRLLAWQQTLLLSMHASPTKRARVAMFNFTFSALLDGPLKPEHRKWAIWILLKRNALSALLGIVSMSTVDSAWDMQSASATSLQLALCLVVLAFYVLALAWQLPYASVVVNRLQVLYESFGLSILVFLLIYHVQATEGWITMVQVMNLATALVSVLVFGAMLWELARPCHRRIKRKLRKLNCGAWCADYSDEADEAAAGEPGAQPSARVSANTKLAAGGDGSSSDGSSTSVKSEPSALAMALFPCADMQPAYDLSRPPALPVKRRRPAGGAPVAAPSPPPSAPLENDLPGGMSLAKRESLLADYNAPQQTL